jgi:talin
MDQEILDLRSAAARAREVEKDEAPTAVVAESVFVEEAESVSTIGDETVDILLLALAKIVANTTAALVLKAKSIAECDDEETRTKVISAASQCALATSQLVCIAPTIQSPVCREQLEAAANEVAKVVINLVEICNETTENLKLKGDLMGAAKEVSRTLTDLMERAQVIISETYIDHGAVGAAVSQIAQSIPEVTKEVRLIADDSSVGEEKSAAVVAPAESALVLG